MYLTKISVRQKYDSSYTNTKPKSNKLKSTLYKSEIKNRSPEYIWSGEADLSRMESISFGFQMYVNIPRPSFEVVKEGRILKNDK